MLGSKWLLYKAENSIGGGTNHKKVAQKTEKRKKREMNHPLPLLFPLPLGMHFLSALSFPLRRTEMLIFLGAPSLAAI